MIGAEQSIVFVGCSNIRYLIIDFASSFGKSFTYLLDSHFILCLIGTDVQLPTLASKQTVISTAAANLLIWKVPEFSIRSTSRTQSRFSVFLVRLYGSIILCHLWISNCFARYILVLYYRIYLLVVVDGTFSFRTITLVLKLLFAGPAKIDAEPVCPLDEAIKDRQDYFFSSHRLLLYFFGHIFCFLFC